MNNYHTYNKFLLIIIRISFIVYNVPYVYYLGFLLRYLGYLLRYLSQFRKLKYGTCKRYSFAQTADKYT